MASYPMEFTTSSSSCSSAQGDWMLYPDDYFNTFHPYDLSFPSSQEESESWVNDMPDLSRCTPSLDEIMDIKFLDPNMVDDRLPRFTESNEFNIDETIALSQATAQQNYFTSCLDPSFLQNNGYPTPPSTTSPYSPPMGASSFSSFRANKPAVRPRVSSPPSSPTTASSPTGGKQGVFTCPKCGQVFTFKTNRTRHVNSRACENTDSGKAGASHTKEYPCPIEGCSTVIKRRKDNLAVHLRKIHGLKVVEQK